jgi:hypothetical protein
METIASSRCSSRVVLAKAYDRVVKVAVLQQVFLGLLAMLVLDSGQTARCLGCCVCGFWIGLAIIARRRPFAPTAGDLDFIRWGSLPLFVVAFLAPIFAR